MTNNYCPLREVFFYVEKHLGINLLSIIRSSGVSVLEGFRMYRGLWRNNRDRKVRPLYCGCPLLRGVR